MPNGDNTGDKTPNSNSCSYEPEDLNAIIFMSWFWLIVIIACIIVIFALSLRLYDILNPCVCKKPEEIEQTTPFTNKAYDPYGAGIRFYQSRDDTGSPQTTLEDRQVNGEKIMIEPLTSTPELPNFSQHYNIEANLKNGSVMIERENFENLALNTDELIKASKGL